MPYTIRIEENGPHGTPFGQATQREADTAPQALAVAADEIGSGRSGVYCTATVIDPEGLRVLVYTGHARFAADADRE